MEDLIMAKKTNQRMFHIPSAKNVCEEAETKQLLNCIDKINAAKRKGEMSCSLLSGTNHYLTADNEQQLLEAGYDLIKSFYEHDHSYYLKAIFDENATGSLTIDR